MAPSEEIVLYHYTYSPFARRVVWYLNFRKIPYTQCLQPPYLPRPDTKALGTNYRRIPLMAIGRDIYNDTRLILQVLEQRYPPSSGHPSIAPSTPVDLGIQRLLERYVVDTLFSRAAALIPSNMPLLNDPKFTADRKEYSGREYSKEALDRGRPEALVEIRAAFELLERTFLADGRDWILAGSEPSVVDIEAAWVPYWLKGMKGALDGSVIGEALFPKVFAWIERFTQASAAAAKAAGEIKTIKGDEAVALTVSSVWADKEKEMVIESSDPSGLRRGEVVDVWPTDTGFNHKDRGALVKLDAMEIVVEKETEAGQKVRVHCPRHGFRVVRVDEGKL